MLVQTLAVGICSPDREITQEPRRVLVTGAGPIGPLAAMMGVQRGLEVRVLDRMIDDARK